MIAVIVLLAPGTAKYEDGGMMRSLQIAGSGFHAVTASGNKIDGKIVGLKFTGIADPRTTQPKWEPAQLEFECK